MRPFSPPPPPYPSNNNKLRDILSSTDHPPSLWKTLRAPPRGVLSRALSRRMRVASKGLRALCEPRLRLVRRRRFFNFPVRRSRKIRNLLPAQRARRRWYIVLIRKYYRWNHMTEQIGRALRLKFLYVVIHAHCRPPRVTKSGDESFLVIIMLSCERPVITIISHVEST